MQKFPSAKRHRALLPASFALDVGGLEDRPPFLNFGLVECAERLRRLLVRWENFLTQVSEPRAHRWVGKGLNGHGIELGNNVLGGARGRPKPEPGRHIRPGIPASSTVGISAAAAMRLLAITA